MSNGIPFEVLTELEENFKYLHQHPETALKEFKTTAFIKDYLENKCKVELLDLGLDTGALAIIRGDSNYGSVGFRADIDALPLEEQSTLDYKSKNTGCMHACGHDAHTAILLAFVRLLSLDNPFKGNVIFLFQPAEEAEHGGQRVVDAGLFSKVKIDLFFALHVSPELNVGQIAISAGPFSANVDRFSYEIKGIGTHASTPYKGLNPIKALELLSNRLSSLVAQNIPCGDKALISLTHVSSGSTWNIIPDFAYAEGTVRSFSATARSNIIEKMTQLKTVLEAEGYKVEFNFIKGCPATNNDPKLSELIKEEATKLGLTVVSQRVNLGGEDFSCFQEHVPGAMFNLGTGIGPSLHNGKFKVDPDALKIGLNVYISILKRLSRV